jgi:hypothetical protein
LLCSVFFNKKSFFFQKGVTLYLKRDAQDMAGPSGSSFLPGAAAAFSPGLSAAAPPQTSAAAAAGAGASAGAPDGAHYPAAPPCSETTILHLLLRLDKLERQMQAMHAQVEALTKPNVHAIRCDGCGTYPIRGGRSKCISCLDFDLCDACRARGVHPHHPFMSL